MRSVNGQTRICLMGASYSTGNLGVSALADGAIGGILGAAPGAEITIVSGTRETGEVFFERAGERARIAAVSLRYGKDVFSSNHVFGLYARMAAWRMLGGRRSGRIPGNAILGPLAKADVVADVSGGDSFTDMYGWHRIVLQTLFKNLVLAMGARLVLLPQTIGPFRHAASRAAARRILRRATAIYTRDTEGIEETLAVAGKDIEGRVRFAPDVGLLVEPAEPKAPELVEWLASRSREGILVGMNVSGLLYNGGYTRGNQFGLKADYRAMVRGLLDALVAEPGVAVVLVPHVVTETGNVENDLEACEAAAAGLDAAKRERVHVVREKLGVRGAKYVIGRCEFFAGSRMHACIAALSQGIAAAGLGYSRKFRGVFETLGVAGSVIDLRKAGEVEAVARVLEEFKRREETRGILEDSVPKAKAMVRQVFEELCAMGRADA